MEATKELWEIVAKNADYTHAVSQDVFVVIWHQETTVQGANHLQRACETFAHTRAAGIGLLTIVEAGAPLPPPGPRRAIADFLASGSTYIKCSAVIFEGVGFRASAVRSVVTGLTMLARQAYPHRVCDLESAIEMFESILPKATGRPFVTSAFRSSLEKIRKEIVSSK